MRNDETGCDLVKRTLQSDESAIVKACELLCDYYSRNGRAEEYHAWNRLMIEEAEVEQLSQKERSHVSSKDKFEPHGISEDMLAASLVQLRAIPDLSVVYLVKKRVLFFPHRPLYVLGYTVIRPFFPDGRRRATEVLERIEKSIRLPGDTLVVNVDGDNWIPLPASAKIVIRPVGTTLLGHLVGFVVFLLILTWVVFAMTLSIDQ